MSAGNIQYVVRLPSEPKRVSLVAGELDSRYKTIQLQIQQVGTTKMIRTYLLNVNEVAKDCQVPPAYIGYFLGYQQSCKVKVDTKLPPREQIYISGAYEVADLSKDFERFLKEVVSCPTCGLPEQMITVTKRGVGSNCRGCGSKNKLTFSDSKMERYIMNHPPAAAGWSGNKAGKKEDKGTKRGKKGPKKEDVDEVEDDKAADDAEPKEDGLVNDELAAIADSVAAEIAAGKIAAAPEASISDWKVDTSEEAVAKRQENFLPPSALDAKKFKDDVDAIAKDIEADPAGAVAKLKALQKEKQLDIGRFVERLIGVLFPANCDFIKTLTQPMLKVLHGLAPEGNVEAQSAILDGLEVWCTESNASQPVAIVKFLYDEDVTEEDAIMEWWDRPSGSKSLLFRESVGPMVAWLREAEAESDEEDEE